MHKVDNILPLWMSVVSNLTFNIFELIKIDKKTSRVIVTIKIVIVSLMKII